MDRRAGPPRRRHSADGSGPRLASDADEHRRRRRSHRRDGRRPRGGRRGRGGRRCGDCERRWVDGGSDLRARRGGVCSSRAQNRSERMCARWRRSQGVELVEQVEQCGERDLAPTAGRQHGGDVAARDPAVERGLAHAEQSRRCRPSDGRARGALEVRADGCEVAVMRQAVVHAPQPHGIAHQLLTGQDRHAMLRRSAIFLNIRRAGRGAGRR